jgi:poly(A) polymerase
LEEARWNLPEKNSTLSERKRGAWGMLAALEELKRAKIPFWFEGVSALDQYYKVPNLPFFYVLVDGSLVDLAKVLPGIRFPGREHIDAEFEQSDEAVVYFRCKETQGSRWTPNTLFSPLYDPIQGKYLDPLGVYGTLRKKSVDRSEMDTLLGYEAALLIARYGFQIEPPKDELPRESTPLDVATQRDILTLVLTGKHTASGLQFLFETGYFHRYWPELGVLKDVSHSKEYHPEGDVWDHTTETFTYRKNPDLAISLALLLHDVGKPHAQTWEGRKFDKHAEIGTRIASQFLRRLGFPEPLVMKVLFLVRNHMMPGALKTLPIYRVEKVLESVWFPELLEVYRCDLSSTFRGPGGYYEACKVYRAFLRNKKNPFRTVEGKKIQRIREPFVMQRGRS